MINSKIDVFVVKFRHLQKSSEGDEHISVNSNQCHVGN